MKSLSSKSSDAFLVKDAVILSLSAPGAEKLLNPPALSFREESISELTISSVNASPIL